MKGIKKEEYIQAYKTAVLYGCINCATNGNFYKFTKTNNDLALVPIAGVLLYDSNNPTELGAKLSKKIRIIDYSDYQGKSPIFIDCVALSFNDSIESIAKEQYRKAKNGKMEYIYD